MLASEFSENQFLDLLGSIQDRELGEKFIKCFGGIHTAIPKVLEGYKDAEVNDDTKKDIYIIGDFLFSTIGLDTYKEDWDNYFPILKVLPVGFLVMLLSNWCPKRHCDKLDDSVLSYLLNCYYNTSDITKEIYDSISGFFEEEDLYPEKFKQFKLDEHYKDELLQFTDLDFLIDEKYKITLDTDLLKSICCQVVMNKKLDSEIKLEKFCELVKCFSPSNQFNRKYRDAFILEIYESMFAIGEEWEEWEDQIWREEFYDVNWEWACSQINESINDSVKEESNHISKMLKINPNYRHD